MVVQTPPLTQASCPGDGVLLPVIHHRYISAIVLILNLLRPAAGRALGFVFMINVLEAFMRAIFRPVVTGLSIAGLALSPVAVAAQSSGVLYTVVVPAGGFGSSLFLRELLGALAAARLFCQQIEDQSLQVDCLSDRLEQVADEIPDGTDYD